MNKLAWILALVASSSAWAQGDAEAGKVKVVTCNACHGVSGKAIMPEYPNLAAQHPGYLQKQLNDYKLAVTTSGEQGRNHAVMGGMAVGLSDQDMADLAAHFSKLPPIDGTTPEAVVETGQNLYRFGDPERGVTACIACHGPRGNGTSLSGFPKISGQNAEYIESQLNMFRSNERANDMNAMMRALSVKLTDQEIKDVSQYVGGLH